MRFRPIKNIAEGDYFSLYASVIAALNISHETVIKAVDKIDLKQMRPIDVNY